ncbi:MAG: PTS sugar transporter subunit IIB [Clostridiaceae bacterium]
MVKIKLFCAAGMSTSMLVARMKKAAEDKGVQAEIEAFPESQISKHLDGLDVALLGPQVGYTLPNAKKICEPAGVPVAVIPTVDYGLMNGEKVLDFALKLIASK